MDWRPPALPHRLQCSTIGRPGLNRRVRHGNGCFPRPYRRQILPLSPRSRAIDNSTVKHPSPYFPLPLRKEVIQPHLPIRLPCYDFTPVISPAFGSFLSWITDFGHYQLPWCDGRCVQDPGTYSPRHADSRLLAIPASCRRVAACSPN